MRKSLILKEAKSASERTICKRVRKLIKGKGLRSNSNLSTSACQAGLRLRKITRSGVYQRIIRSQMKSGVDGSRSCGFRTLPFGCQAALRGHIQSFLCIRKTICEAASLLKRAHSCTLAVGNLRIWIFSKTDSPPSNSKGGESLPLTSATTLAEDFNLRESQRIMAGVRDRAQRCSCASTDVCSIPSG